MCGVACPAYLGLARDHNGPGGLQQVFKTTLDEVVKETIELVKVPETIESSIILAATWTQRAKHRTQTAKKDESLRQKKAADALKATEDKGAETVKAHK